VWEKEQKKSADSVGEGEAEMEVDEDVDASGKLKAVWEWFNNLTPEVVPCLCLGWFDGFMGWLW
jgi:hypothetical protein